MLYRLRQRTGDEGGFTLIELLVVILIIGILAAIAIPSLLSQKNKAYSAGMKQLAQSAYTAAETYATDHEGSYTGLEASKVQEYEKTIPISKEAAHGGAYISAVTVLEEGKGFEVTASNEHTPTTFTLKHLGNGQVERTCTPVSVPQGCATGSW
jgi:type IV pilus assembly protein PilA